MKLGYDGASRRRLYRVAVRLGVPDGWSLRRLLPEHDDDSSSVIDRVDDPQRADTDPQEVGTGQLGCAAGSRVEAEGENGTAELRRGARWQATELTLRGRR